VRALINCRSGVWGSYGSESFPFRRCSNLHMWQVQRHTKRMNREGRTTIFWHHRIIAFIVAKSEWCLRRAERAMMSATCTRASQNTRDETQKVQSGARKAGSSGSVGKPTHRSRTILGLSWNCGSTSMSVRTKIVA
jgi:hypothetical protein